MTVDVPVFRPSRGALGLLVLAALASCNGSVVSVGAPELCRTVTPAGGNIEFPFDAQGAAKVVLTVPVDAVAQPTQVCVASTEGLLGGKTALGPVISLEPRGLTFRQPVRLRLPYDPSAVPTSGVNLAVAKWPTGDDGVTVSDVLALDPATRLGTTEIDQLALYQIVVTPPNNGDGMNSKLDLLFVIDNSPSMLPKQQALADNIPRFMALLDQTVTDAGTAVMRNIDYHIGVVTSDLGSTVAPNTPWQASIGACDTYAGDDGKLQNMPCTARNLTGAALAACKTLCPDPTFVPGTDPMTMKPYRYIWRQADGKTNVPPFTDPMTGKDLGPARAFQCMALLGDNGCAIEGQLEAMRRALDGHALENMGFLRKDSLLAVVFITDEDDCSVQLARRAENNPATRDCPTGDESPECFNYDFRCLAASLTCTGSMSSPGTKTACKERPGNYLEPVQSRYVQFLKQLRMNANHRLISGIWTMPPVDNGGKLVISGLGTAGPSRFLDRAKGADATCVDGTDSSVFGLAQRRLSNFACSLAGSYQQSICNRSGWDLALYNIYQAIVTKAKMLPPGEKLDPLGCPP